MAYEQLYRIMEAPVGGHPLWRQAYVAILKAASDIRSEDQAMENHANRLVWAAEVEQDPAAAVMAMKSRLLQNATLRADPTGVSDNDVQFVVNGLIDVFATGS